MHLIIILHRVTLSKSHPCPPPDFVDTLPYSIGKHSQICRHDSAIMKFIVYLMIFIANKRNQVTAHHIESEKLVG